MPGVASVVEGVTTPSGESLAATEQFETERTFLEAFHDELRPEDTVWVVGAREGLYPLLAATHCDTVHTFDNFEGRPAVRRRLERAGVTVSAPSAGPTAPAGSSVDAPAPTVVVVDEAAVDGDGLGETPAGRLLSARLLLVKSDRRIEDELTAAGYETERLRRFDPLRSPWREVVTARRSPTAPVNPAPNEPLVAPPESADGARAGALVPGLTDALTVGSGASRLEGLASLLPGGLATGARRAAGGLRSVGARLRVALGVVGDHAPVGSGDGRLGIVLRLAVLLPLMCVLVVPIGAVVWAISSAGPESMTEVVLTGVLLLILAVPVAGAILFFRMALRR